MRWTGRSQEQWQNWAGNQSARPAQVAQARDLDDVSRVVRSAADRGLRVRPVGAGHSFTAAAVTDGVLLRLDHLTGVTDIDPTTLRVRVLAGTRLHQLNPALQAAGLALPNLGDIDRQAVAGAIATGTHGTGARLHGIASSVTGLTMTLADGSVLQCSAEQHPDVFQAARVGLGALGVVTEVELQCVPAFRLQAVERPEPLLPLLERIQEEADAHDHFELYWFPHTDRTMTKRNDRVPAAAAGPGPLPAWRAWLDDELLANGLFEQVNRVGARWPPLVPGMAQLTARALSPREFSDDSWRVFCSRRAVRFVESEYAVPRAAVRDVVLALKDWVDRHDDALPFPVEVRFLAADDVWLSTAYGRDTAYVAVHQYHRMEHARYFSAFEAIVAEHAGRPHWGKLHTLDAERLRPLYPRFDDVLRVRRQLDPTGLFGNDYLERVLGPP
jgi:L-gulonolactone oxidase